MSSLVIIYLKIIDILVNNSVLYMLSRRVHLIIHTKSSIFQPTINHQDMDNNQIITPKLSNELSAIFENADVVLILVDRKGRVVNINQAGLDMIKKDKNLIIGKQNGEVFSCINAYRDGRAVCGNTNNCKDCTVRQQINTGLIKNVRQKKEDGKLTVFDDNGKSQVIHLLVSTSNITIDDEEYMLLTIDEVSRIKKQEEELKRLNQDKDKFLSILSHDLRSPYNSFIGFTEILLDRWKTMPPEQVDKILSSLLSVSKNSYELLDDLLSWAKSQSGKTQFEPQINECTTIYESVLKSIQYSAELKQLNMQFIAKDGCKVYADAKMLGTILRNLLSNAVKFSERGKNITTEIKNTYHETIITVNDEGTGIPADIQEHLFSLTLVSSSPGTDGEKGSGLGLLLCKEFVEKHQGTISVSSELGVGSTFTIVLPHYRP